jgi:short-subunit dehydrogenase
MNKLTQKYGPWAIVTGASSGIGEAFARRLAADGMNLVLVARQETRLRRVANTLEAQHGIESRIVAVDLAEEGFLDEIRKVTDGLAVGLLVNNAGIATNGNFLDGKLDEELSMLHVNSRAPLALAHHFGNRMRKDGRGGIIFVSSVLGFSGVPTWSHYAATKAFDHVLAEGLARELRPHGVNVLGVAPGPTRTPFWKNSVSRLLPFTSPERVARVAISKLGRRSTVTVGWINSLIVFSTRLLPRSINARIFGLVVRLLKWATSSKEAITSSQQPTKTLVSTE